MDSLINKRGSKEIISPWRPDFEQGIFFDLQPLLKTLRLRWHFILVFGILGFLLGSLILPVLPGKFTSKAELSPPELSDIHSYLLIAQELDLETDLNDIFDRFRNEAGSSEAIKDFWRTTSIFTHKMATSGQPETSVMEDLSKRFKVKWDESSSDQELSSMTISLDMPQPDQVQSLLSDYIQFVNLRVANTLKDELQLLQSERIEHLENIERTKEIELSLLLDEQKEKLEEAFEMASSLGIKDARLILQEPELLEKGPLYVRGQRWLKEEIDRLDDRRNNPAFIEGHSDRMAKISIIKALDPEKAEMNLFKYRSIPGSPERGILYSYLGIPSLLMALFMVTSFSWFALRSRVARVLNLRS